MSLTRNKIQRAYPDVYELYNIQAALSEDKYEEKMKFWAANNINCFERWAVPYFLLREREKKRPCLRLNYPPYGKCGDCAKGTCRYDKICFMCGIEGHGAFQSFPGGKLKGELKCSKHKNFLSQLATIQDEYGMDEDDLRVLFELTPPPAQQNTAVASKAAVSSVEPVHISPPTPLTSSFSAVTSPPSSSSNSISNSNSKTISNISSKPRSGISYLSTASNTASSESISIRSISNGSASQPPIKPTPHPAASSTPVIHPQHQSIDQLSIGGDNDSLTPSPVRSLSDGSSPYPLPHQTLSSPLPVGSYPSPQKSSQSLSPSQSQSPIGSSLVPTIAPISAWPPTSPGLLNQMGSLGLSGNFTLNPISFDGSVGDVSSSVMHTLELSGDSDDYGCPMQSVRIILSSLLSGADATLGCMLCRGSLVNGKGRLDDVLVRAWHPNSVRRVSTVLQGLRQPSEVEEAAKLRTEVKALRRLAKRCVHISRISHLSMLEVELNGDPKAELSCIVSEYSDLGHLDRYTMNMLSEAGQGYSQSDLQSMCNQLIEAVMACHEMNIAHRDIRPSNILVTSAPYAYYSPQFNGPSGPLILKLSNFTPASLSPSLACNHMDSSNNREKWQAPEVSVSEGGERTGSARSRSDLWSLGLVFYYLATGGNLPFESHQQSCETGDNQDLRRQCLDRHGLEARLPMLYDLIERLVRPESARADLQDIRCHPFLWTMEGKKNMLVNFATASVNRGNHSSESINNFANTVDKISPLYVFQPVGWVAAMSQHLLDLVQPPKLKSDFSKSGCALLFAIKNQLLSPDVLQQSVAYTGMGLQQMLHEYIREITDVNFPRLLILLFELGSINGHWHWDGDEISYSWK